jgi:carboxyl-terminal processing protease
MLQLKKFWPVPCSVAIGLVIWAGCETGQMAPPPAVALPANSLKPGPDDPRIAFVAARLLEEYHYLQHPLDKDLSAKFFDGYIDSLDSRHEHFLQSDLAEFAPFRTNLDTLTLGRNLTADLSPAFAIYQRYQERFQQHTAYVNELLQQDKFKFNTEDKIQIDRRHEPFPKDLAEAQQFWRQHVRYEYLQDKLGREISETNGVFTIKLPADANTNIIYSLQKRYRWNQHLMTNQDSDSVLSAYLNALAHAYDPHSDYMSAPHAQDFSISMNLALFGIGAQLTEDDGYCTIHALVAGGPASKSKLLNEKDRIVAVAQAGKPPMDVVDMELEKVVQQIRGPKGTEVQLTITSAPDYTTRKVISLVRDEIKLEDSEAKAKLLEMPDDHGGTNRIGILELPSFYAPVGDLGPNNGRATPKYTSVDVAKLVKKLKQEHVAGIIIDLRYNPGGSLEEAIKFTGLFIKAGPVVLARNPDGQVTVDSDNDPQELYDGPLMVMINRFSASAAEIAAAALQDYGRALIVGDTSTHGKGTVQNLNPLKPFMLNSTNDPGALKITIRKFYRVNGASTQLKGVMPDIVLPDVLNYYAMIGETNLDNPLPWDTIQPASYEKFNLVQPYLADLHKQSDARILTNRDFAYVQQDIEQYKKTQADRTATLNEREAIKERERVALQQKMRDKERDSRPLPGLKIYELTVKNSTEPGLPEPKPFFTTNYDISTLATLTYKDLDVKKFFGTTNPVHQAATVPNGNVVYVFTNFFTAGYTADFAHFFRTNYPDLTDVKFIYTNSPATNIIAEQHTSSTNQIFKPVVNKTYSPDPVRDESERILEDYISLLPKGGSLTVIP